LSDNCNLIALIAQYAVSATERIACVLTVVTVFWIYLSQIM